jgi:hypothetical protein
MKPATKLARESVKKSLPPPVLLQILPGVKMNLSPVLNVLLLMAVTHCKLVTVRLEGFRVYLPYTPQVSNVNDLCS